jgi:hypothetical protein
MDHALEERKAVRLGGSPLAQAAAVDHALGIEDVVAESPDYLDDHGGLAIEAMDDLVARQHGGAPALEGRERR